MTSFVDTILESFKQTLNWSMWLYFFLIFFIEGIILGIIALSFVFIGFFTLLGPITNVGGIENIAMLFSDLSFIASSIGILWFLFTVFIIIATFIVAIFTGMRYHLFNDFLKTGKFNLGKSFQKTKPRVFTYFLISIFIGLVILTVFVLAFAPVLFIIPELIGGTVAGPNVALIAPLIFTVLLMFLIGLILLLISPMLNLLAPTVFFEEKGAIDTIKKALELMKANYWGNLAYVILYFLIIFAISMLFQLLVLPFTILLSIIDSSRAAAVGLLGFAGLIMFIIMVVYSIWSTVFDTACFRNLYFLDKSLLAKHVPHHAAKTKSKSRKKKAKKKTAKKK